MAVKDADGEKDLCSGRRRGSISGHSSTAELERTATGMRASTCTSFKTDERVCDKRVESISRGTGVDEESIVGALSVVWRPTGKPVSRYVRMAGSKYWFSLAT
jgi:hypothetical protein